MTEDVKRVAAAIAGNPTAWRWANGLILVAAIVPALGLVPINLRFEGPARAWASTGLVAFVFAALFAAIYRMISIQVTTWAAPQYPDPTAFAVWEAFEGLGAGIPRRSSSSGPRHLVLRPGSSVFPHDQQTEQRTPDRRNLEMIASTDDASRMGFLLRNDWRFEADGGPIDTLRSGGQVCC